jgi:DNA replication protein
MTEQFKGFAPGKHKTIPLYAEFFSELLPLIDDLAELRVMLFCFRALQQKEGTYRYLRRRDFQQDEALMRGLAFEKGELDAVLDAALAKAVERGALLCATIMLNDALESLYFMNTVRGRQAVTQIEAGKWQPSADSLAVEILPERPNAFTLYEANIGPLTAHIADAIKDAERDFSSAWVEDAIKLAVEYNKRNWKYVRAILEGWKREGRYRDEVTAGQPAKDGQQYINGKYSDIIES